MATVRDSRRNSREAAPACGRSFAVLADARRRVMGERPTVR
jgi:hypothetical protein